MVDTKEIKNIKLTPFTRMSASIYAIIGLVSALIMLVILIIVQASGITTQLVPELANFNWITAVGIPLMVIIPLVSFIVTVAVSFISATLYNLLVPRLGGIKLELEGEDLEKIPVIAFSLITSAIGAIWAFIIGLLMAAFLSPFFSLISSLPIPPEITADISNATGTAINGSVVGSVGILVTLLLVIGLPIMVFVFGFIWNALFALLYNYLVTRVAKIKLNFSNITGSLYELTHIPVMPTALAVALLYALLGIISGILNQNYGEFITNFIWYFIATAIAARAYNYLAPKIGSIKLNME
ncbi:MAG: hypothetical protein KKF16_07440 [Euryarchaeota archaeon]|nr:hypothetical protein [Euryarchaeota archaeon]MBU4608328.1 hypothetical protein [Euryarchaeota archaeon]MBV1729470.1 hypothetical protein [Methanobacterium sp.]MBV1756164.1 hypothetical protein [Methanobacterium sp.]